MGYKIVELDKVAKEYTRYLNEHTINTSLDSNHLRIRQFFLDNYYVLKQKYKDLYSLDVELGLLFYEFMNKEKDFSHLYSSDYLFWRNVAVFDIPDIIADRFGSENAVDHFYRKTTRVYPYVLYWYINMSWQGSIEQTREVLKGNSTDEILQLVERPSKIGINLDFYRELMKEYSNEKYDTLKKEILKKNKVQNKNLTLFRLIMTRNTSKLLVFRPEIYSGGITGYVKMLFDIREDLI